MQILISKRQQEGEKIMSQQKIIDCLFIGYNQVNFQDYESQVRKMGVKNGAYRDLNLSFFKFNDQLFTFPDIYNSPIFNPQAFAPDFNPYSLGDGINAAIAYLGTYLQRRGYTFDYINFFQSKKAELAEKLQRGNIRAVAITTTYYLTIFPILEVVAFIKEHNPDVKIILGGPFIASQFRNESLETIQYLFKTLGADFYVNSSQGEATLVKILQALRENTSVEQIPNITYRLPGDQYITNPIELEKNKLEENMVNWELFADQMDEYISLRTSISCPFACAFCGFPQHAGKYQTADIAAIEAELNQIAHINKVKSVMFIDDTINVPADRFKEFLRMMIRNKYQFKWHANFRCQFADDEMVQLMKESGCEGVFLGIESGSPQILKNMNKAATIDQYKNGISLLQKYDIPYYASFIIGFPGETEETVQETLDFIKETRPNFFRTLLWYCDPITPIYQQRDKYQIQGSQFTWSHLGMDSDRASDIIDEVFLNCQDSLWVPQYSFEFFGMFHLIHRGMPMQQLTELIRAFNLAVREKFDAPDQKEVSSEAILRIKEVLAGQEFTSSKALDPAENGREEAPKFAADFDF